MNTQSAQTPISDELVTITLTAPEFAFIHGSVSAIDYCNSIELEVIKEEEAEQFAFIHRLKNKLDYFQSNSGDACRHPVQSSDALGQGGTTDQVNLGVCTKGVFSNCHSECEHLQFGFCLHSAGQGGNQ